MKKILLITVVVLITITAKAQEGKFNAGVNLGLPIGDAGELYSFAVGGELNYMFKLSDEFQLGPSVSYNHFLGKTKSGFDIPSIGIMPIAAAGRFNVSDEFILGADLGIAIGVSEASGTHFYFRPLVGYALGENVTVQAHYSSADKLNVFGLGLMYGF